jgi:hypothetical protein
MHSFNNDFVNIYGMTKPDMGPPKAGKSLVTLGRLKVQCHFRLIFLKYWFTAFIRGDTKHCM